jgi:hypothetical protein
MKSIIYTILLGLVAMGNAVAEKPKPWVYSQNGEFAGNFMQSHKEEGTGPHNFIHLYEFGDRAGLAFWACVVTIPALAGQPDAKIISRLTLNDNKASISSLSEHKLDFVVFPDGSRGIIYNGMTFVKSKVESSADK